MSTKALDIERDFDQAPEGAQCWILDGEAEAGLPIDFDPDLSSADLFCPACLKDPRYAADEPLRRIEQRLLAPVRAAGDYDCQEWCHRWLLRPDAQQDAAMMLVRVGMPTVCGATGWCPGRIYEQREGKWHLAGSYASNESDELCVFDRRGAGLRLWLTPLGDPIQTLEIDWRY